MRDQNGNPLYKDVRRNPYDGLWYVTVWFGMDYASTVRRYGYGTQAEAREGDIGDFDALSYHEPRDVCEEED